MKTKLLLLLLTLSSVAGFAQGYPLKGRQMESATAEGQVWVAGSDLKGRFINSPFPRWVDTATHIATKSNVALVDGKTITAGNFANGDITFTRLNGSTFNVTIGSGYYIPISQKASPNGVATLGADGRVPAAQLPAQQVSATFVVASEAEMLALSTAKQGDFAKRTDVSKMYVLRQTPASTLANWEEWFDNTGVQLVNGQSGPNVNLTTDNISEGATNKYFTLTAARQAYTGVGAINVNSGNGQISLNNSTVVAGSNYNNFTVNAQGIITAASNIAYLLPAALTNYYTKDESATAGQAQFHWDNIINKPNNIALNLNTQQSTGSTSSTITLNFTPAFGGNTPVYFNGQKLTPTVDYSISGTTLTLGIPRASSDMIMIDNYYRN